MSEPQRLAAAILLLLASACPMMEGCSGVVIIPRCDNSWSDGEVVFLGKAVAQLQPGGDVSHPANRDFAECVTASFAKQSAMHLIRATLQVVEQGRTEIHVPCWDGIEQQHGFVHGGVVGMIADSAAGYAAMTIVGATASVLSVEYKINLVAPADGAKLIARGQVIRPGRTLIVTRADVFAVKEDQETLCALMQQTVMVMRAKTEKG